MPYVGDAMRALTLVVLFAAQAFAVQNQSEPQPSPQAQASPAQPSAQTSPAPATAAKEPLPALNGFGLEDGTPVKRLRPSVAIVLSL